MARIPGFISVGTEVTIEISGIEERFKSRMIGVDTDRFLVLRTPVSISAGLIQSSLNPGTGLIIRYLVHGTVWGFRSAIIQTLSGEIGVLFAEFPAEVENYDLRAAQRVEARIPVRLMTEQESAEGMIVDLSATGARVLFEPGQLEAGAPAPEAEIRLLARLDTNEAPSELSCVVRSTQEDSARISLGVQYADLEPEAKESISKYIERVVAFADV